jgi:hypothetical protein
MNLAFVPVARAADELRALFVKIDHLASSGKLQRRAHAGYSSTEDGYSHDRD